MVETQEISQIATEDDCECAKKAVGSDVDQKQQTSPYKRRPSHCMIGNVQNNGPCYYAKLALDPAPTTQQVTEALMSRVIGPERQWKVDIATLPNGMLVANLLDSNNRWMGAVQLINDKKCFLTCFLSARTISSTVTKITNPVGIQLEKLRDTLISFGWHSSGDSTKNYITKSFYTYPFKIRFDYEAVLSSGIGTCEKTVWNGKDAVVWTVKLGKIIFMGDMVSKSNFVRALALSCDERSVQAILCIFSGITSQVTHRTASRTTSPSFYISPEDQQQIRGESTSGKCKFGGITDQNSRMALSHIINPRLPAGVSL